MRVLNGKDIDKDTEDPVLASACWCEIGDVTQLCAEFTKPHPCEIIAIAVQAPFLNAGGTCATKDNKKVYKDMPVACVH